MKKYTLSILFVIIAHIAFAQIITTVAGTGAIGYSGDGGPALTAKFHEPVDIAFDKQGNMYVTDVLNYCIRKISTTGIITTFAGNGTNGLTLYGSAATATSLMSPKSVCVDNAGNILITDVYYIAKVDTSGIISKIAGNPTASSFNNVPALNGRLTNVVGIALDNLGHLYIGDEANSRLKVVRTDGKMYHFGGTGSPGDPRGDNGPVLFARLTTPMSVKVDKDNNVYFVDSATTVRKVNPAGVVTTVAGNRIEGFSGDGGPATAASFHQVQNVIVDKHGNLYIADALNHRIRKVSTNGIVTTVVGNGTAGFSGDGGPATAASLNGPWGMALDSVGNLFIVDVLNQRIRKVSGLYTDVPVIADKTAEPLIFPNPVQDELTIEVDKDSYHSLVMYDIIGKIVLQKVISQNNVKINMAGIPAGVYYLEFKNEAGVVVKKVIKI